jgi:hypothetical protein
MGTMALTPWMKLMSELATLKRIQQVVCLHYDISMPVMLGDQKSRQIAWPRQLAIWMSSKLTGASISSIARHFNRDHTTALHAKKSVNERMKDVNSETFKDAQVLMGEFASFHSYGSLRLRPLPKEDAKKEKVRKEGGKRRPVGPLQPKLVMTTRACLHCSGLFESEGIHNRLCASCKHGINNSAFI